MINRAVLVGRLTRDVEVRKTQSGISCAMFTVACDRNRKKDENSNEPTADFISCVAWRQPADFLGQYAHKGSLVGIDGRIQTRTYEKDGQRIYMTEVVADQVRLLESKSSTAGSDRPPVSSGSVRLDQISTNGAKDWLTGGDEEIDSDELPF